MTAVVSDSEIEVWWMYGKAWHQKWLYWRDAVTKKPYKEVIKSSHVLQDTHGQAARVSFQRKRAGEYLDTKSQGLILEILSVGEYSHDSEK